MSLLDSLTTLDKPTIIIIVMGIVIVVLLYINYMRTNESNARLGSCNCSTEHLTVTGQQSSTDDEKQNIPIPKLDEIQDPKKAKLTVYYTTWCGYSKMFLNEWDKNLLPAVDSAEDIKSKVIFEKVDCDKNTEVCEKYKIEGYPTVLFHSADGNVHEYNGERSAAKIIAFMREKL